MLKRLVVSSSVLLSFTSKRHKGQVCTIQHQNRGAFCGQKLCTYTGKLTNTTYFAGTIRILQQYQKLRCIIQTADSISATAPSRQQRYVITLTWHQNRVGGLTSMCHSAQKQTLAADAPHGAAQSAQSLSSCSGTLPPALQNHSHCFA